MELHDIPRKDIHLRKIQQIHNARAVPKTRIYDKGAALKLPQVLFV